MLSRFRLLVVCAASLVAAACEMPEAPLLAQSESSLGSALTRLRAYNDATNNYYAMSFSGPFAFHRIYIDTDESTATGFSYCGVGANYLIENTHAYQYTGDGTSWSWSDLGSITNTIDAAGGAWTVPRSTFGETAYPNRARMCFETKTSTDVKDTSAIYTHVYSDETLPVHAFVAYNDGATIFYQATFNTAITYKHVFIDTDESTATGYNNHGIGADYMIENSTVYDYTGDGTSWSWTSLGDANMSPSTQGAIGVTTWSIARTTIGETGASERADLLFHGSPTYSAIYDHVYSGGTSTPPPGTVEDTSFVTDDDPTLKNPERGMYFGSVPDTSGEFHTIVPKWLWLDSVCGQNLTWNGHNQTGTSTVLNAYADTLEAARTGGYKVLFRPRYDKQGDNSPSDCLINGVRVFHADSKTRQLNHIDAIAAMLGDYKDAVAYIQMGYLGRWGEWNTSGYSSSNAPLLYSYTDRNEIIDRVLSSYGAEGVQPDVELRRPVFAKEVIDRNSTANVGQHNDCFMTSDSDAGTYSDFTGSPANFGSTAAAKAWAQSFSANSSYGGETCNLDGAERWRSCTNMLSEPPTLHVNYLNGDYATGAVSTWTSNGCYDEIRRKLGYRFKVTRVEYTPTVAAGGTFTVEIDIVNSGWAKLHRPRTAKVVLRSGASSTSYTPSNSGTSGWAPGTTTTLVVTASAPSTAGTYSIRLAIPDPDAPARIPYAVKLASLRNGVNVFDPTYGENNLGVSITVQ
jgi:hypothetical protein